MTQPAEKPRVGLVGLTLELYEQLAPGLRQRREDWLRRDLLPALAAAADVRFARAAYRRQDVEAIVADYEAAGVEALVVVCLTYAPSQIVLPALQRTRLPILVWNTQELEAVDASFDEEKMAANHGVHGTQDLANVLVRSEVPFHYVTSHPAERPGLAEVADFLIAAAAVARLRRTRIGILGYPFPGMGDFAVDTTHLAASLGVPVDVVGGRRVHPAVRRGDGRRGSALVAEYRRALRRGRRRDRRRPGGHGAGGNGAACHGGRTRLQAISYQFMAFGEDERTVTLPFVAASRLMADGVGFAGEGDLVGAAGTWLLEQLAPPASFSEIFTIDFGGNALLAAHMGEANVAMARSDRKVPLVARSSPVARTRGRQLALVRLISQGRRRSALCLGPRQRWR